MIDEGNYYQPWNDFAAQVAFFAWGVGLLIIVIYMVKLMIIRDNKDKYDFIIRHEITWLWISSIFLIVGTCFFANANIIEITDLWIAVRAFVSVALGTIAGILIRVFLKFYYPFFIEKRLKVLRYRPRISPKTGKPMKLLSEEEEDAFLDEGMQAEENVFSVDYDVWKDEETGLLR